MVLGESLEDEAGRRHAMTGLLGHATSFAKRKLHLGYRTARLLSDCLLGRGGTIVRGHEFHYAALVSAGADEPFAEVADSDSRRREKSRRPARPRHRRLLPRHRRGAAVRRRRSTGGSCTQCSHSTAAGAAVAAVAAEAAAADWFPRRAASLG